jgi:CRP-like cAMP-binding protein
MPSQDGHALAPLLRKLRQFCEFEEADSSALLALPHVVKSISPLGYLVREGDRPTHSSLLVHGFAFRHKIVADGARQICAVHMAGDMVDLQNSLLGTADHNVQALTQADFVMIPRAAIRQLAFDRPHVAMALWYDTLVEGSISREWIANVGRRSAMQRLAHLLCEIAIRLEAAGLGDHMSYVLPMTQEQLADCTGLTSVHVNRTLRALDELSVIERSKRAVTVKDWKALAGIGDFTAGYLHMKNGNSVSA